MTIQSPTIATHRANICFPIKLLLSKAEGGGNLRDIWGDEAEKLIERRVVEAKVSNGYQKFHHLRLTCELAEADRITKTVDEQHVPGTYRCQASSTAQNENINGDRIAFRVWRHTGEKAFAPWMRTQFA